MEKTVEMVLADTILAGHFQLGIYEIDDIMESMADLGLLNEKGMRVRKVIREQTIESEKTETYEDMLERGRQRFGEHARKYLIETRKEVANKKVKKFLELKNECTCKEKK
jgi:hypothetical protein